MTLEELSIVYTADISGAVGAIEALNTAVNRSAAEAEKAESAFSQAGRQAGLGLAAGIRASEGAVTAAARLVAARAAAALRDALQIHSPSKVTQQSGKHFGDGLTQGIRAGEKDARGAAESLAAAAANGLRDRIPEGTQDHMALALLQGQNALRSAEPDGERGFAPPSAANGNGGDISLTIPVELDGIQLGIATVNSLNALRRGTGNATLS